MKTAWLSVVPPLPLQSTAQRSRAQRTRSRAVRTCSLLLPCSLMARISPMTRSGCWMRTVVFCSSGTCGHSAVSDPRSSTALISPARSAAPRSPSCRAAPVLPSRGAEQRGCSVSARRSASSFRGGPAVAFLSPPALEAERERLKKQKKQNDVAGADGSHCPNPAPPRRC